MMKRVVVTLAIFLCAFSVSQGFAATWYVDNAATGLNNGTSWADAWESFGDIRSLSPGDVVYISGGPTMKMYYETLISAPGVTYRTGQAVGHSGMVIIDGQDTRANCIRLANGVTISGEVNSQRRLRCTRSAASGIDGANRDITISYVEIVDVGGDGIHFTSDAEGCEISHSYIARAFQDGINAAGGPSSRWGANSVHDTTIVNICDDGIGTGVGWDIYNNIIGECTLDTSVNPHCAGAGGHPDGMQLQRRYYRVYNNVVYDAATYLIWLSTTQPGVAGHMRVYNNVLYMTNHSYFGNNSQGIAFVADHDVTTELTDIIVTNNTLVDIFGHGITVGARYDYQTASDIYIYNNIIHNSRGTIRHEFPSGVTVDHNSLSSDGYGVDTIQYLGSIISQSTYQSRYGHNIHGNRVSPSFSNYSRFGVRQASDVMLLPDDTAALDSGIPVTSFSYFDPLWPSDHFGTLRPQGSGWDIGFSEYDGESNSSPPSFPDPPPDPPMNLRVIGQ